MRNAGLVALATVFVVGCTASPSPTPSSPSGPSTATFSPSASDATSTAESPGPTDVPSRDIRVGGTLTVMLGDETASFADVQCDVARGLSVVASGAGQAGVTFTVEDDEVLDVVLTLPSGRTGLVGGFAGSAEFGGDQTNFQLSGEASSIDPTPGAVHPLRFTITGTCLAPGAVS